MVRITLALIVKCLCPFLQLEEKQQFIESKTAELEAQMRFKTSEERAALQNELLEVTQEAKDVETEIGKAAAAKVLGLEYERDVSLAEIERLTEENEELRNKSMIQNVDRILPSFSPSSQLYERFCVDRGFEYSVRGIQTGSGGKNLLHVSIIEARDNHKLLPVYAWHGGIKSIF